MNSWLEAAHGVYGGLIYLLAYLVLQPFVLTGQAAQVILERCERNFL